MPSTHYSKGNCRIFVKSEGELNSYKATILKAYDSRWNPKKDPGNKETKRDIAILRLKDIPPAQPLKIAENLGGIPELGLVVGYGEKASGQRQAFLQIIKPKKLKKWGMFSAQLMAGSIWKRLGVLWKNPQNC